LLAILFQLGLFGVYPSPVYLGKERHHVGMQHGSEKFSMQRGMAKTLPEAISLNVTVRGVDLSIAKLNLRGDVIPERTSEDAVDVDFE
jgi:hypothetical protein